MTKKTLPTHRQQHVPVAPVAPEPSAASAADGVEEGQALARRYWPDLVRLHAAIPLSPDSTALLHTRMLSAKEIRELAGGMPQTAPAPPKPPGDSGDRGKPV